MTSYTGAERVIDWLYGVVVYWGNYSPSSTSQQDHGSEEAYEDVQQQPKDPGEGSDPTTFTSIVQTELTNSSSWFS